MTKNGEKEFIPGSKPDYNLELPDGDVNSLVAKSGKNWDNGYNFDEKEEPEDDFDPEAAKKAKEERRRELKDD